MAKKSNPPQSFLNCLIALGLAALAGNSKSVSCSLKAESNTRTGSPLENASMACSMPGIMALGGASHTRYFRFQASFNIFLFNIF